MHSHLSSMHDGFAVIGAAIGAALASVVTLLAQAPAAAFQGAAIYDDERLRLICIVGALGGSVVNLWLFPSPPGISLMARKVSCSSITGVVCTPIFVHWLNAVPNIDNLLAISFLSAITSVGLLRAIIPMWQKFFVSKFNPPSDK